MPLCYLAVMKSILVAVILLAVGFIAEAQQTRKPARIGWLSLREGRSEDDESLKQQLRTFGWVEGNNIAFDYRWAEGRYERYPELAADLARLKVDVIVTSGQEATRAAMNATRVIPIIALASDPVGAGLVKSLAHPGGNVTGLSLLAPELSGKRVEIFKETFPKTRYVAVIWTTASRNGTFKETRTTAKALGLKVLSLEVRTPDDFDGAFDVIRKNRPQGIVVVNSAIMGANSKRIIDFAAKSRSPAMYPESRYVEDGGLMAYGTRQADLFRRAAVYVDKILRGSKPGDLPVEQPMKFELVINLKTARQNGLEIPQWTLMKADRVIR
jgi:putative tryptophan/tyrosine transport system substrate-binding protein